MAEILAGLAIALVYGIWAEFWPTPFEQQIRGRRRAHERNEAKP